MHLCFLWLSVKERNKQEKLKLFLEAFCHRSALVDLILL